MSESSRKNTSGNRFPILVVEDEADIRDLLVLHLKREGYPVEIAADGESALKILRQKTGFSLIILDWMLPEMSGLELVREIRKGEPHARVPVLMVTARTEPTDIVAGLESGADDYVTKPFEVAVLLARVRALLRRAQADQQRQERSTTALDEGPVQIQGLLVNPLSYEVKCHDSEITLTPSEFRLLWTLIQNRGRVLTRDQLIDRVQGAGVAVVERAIDTHIFGLRKKLGACADVVETVRGIGYRVVSE